MPWQPGWDDPDARERHRLLKDRLEQLADKRGEDLGSDTFVNEDVVGALEAGDLDEAYLLAGRQAREYLRSFASPYPTQRQMAITDMTEAFERLARLVHPGVTNLPAADVRRRLGLRSAWDSAGGNKVVTGLPGMKTTGGYFDEVAGVITEAARAGNQEEADLTACLAVEAHFKVGEPVSVEGAVAEYRRLLEDAGVTGLDDAAIERWLGLGDQPARTR